MHTNIVKTPQHVYQKNNYHLSYFSLSQLFSQDVIRWKFSLQEKGYNEIELVANATIQKGWHVYDTKTPENTAFPTTLNINKLIGAETIETFHAAQKAHISFDPVFNAEIGTFENSVKFIQRFKISDKTKFRLGGRYTCSGM